MSSFLRNYSNNFSIYFWPDVAARRLKRHIFCIFHRGGRMVMIRKLKSGEYRLYSKKKDAKTGKRKNLGTFKSREAAEKHERAVQYFKHH
jgi:hypothetical protein